MSEIDWLLGTHGYPPDEYDERDPEPHSITCKFCKRTDLEWRQVYVGPQKHETLQWRLFDPDTDEQHYCNVPVDLNAFPDLPCQ